MKRFNFQYWVDPNAGDPKDAILVHCDMDADVPATCIQPKPSLSEEIAVISNDKSVWFSEIPERGFTLTYKADSNQITFLQVSLCSQFSSFDCYLGTVRI